MSNVREEVVLARINEVLDQLTDEFPEQGFLVLGMTPKEGETDVVAVTNVERSDLPLIFEQLLQPMPESPSSSTRLN